MEEFLGGRFEKSDACLFREVDGEAVILNLDDENYYGLNPCGVVIWHALIDGQTLAEAVQKVLETFEVSQDVATEDAVALVQDLVRTGILAPEPSSIP